MNKAEGGKKPWKPKAVSEYAFPPSSSPQNKEK